MQQNRILDDVKPGVGCNTIENAEVAAPLKSVGNITKCGAIKVRSMHQSLHKLGERIARCLVHKSPVVHTLH